MTSPGDEKLKISDYIIHEWSKASAWDEGVMISHLAVMVEEFAKEIYILSKVLSNCNILSGIPQSQYILIISQTRTSRDVSTLRCMMVVALNYCPALQ